MRFFHHFHSVYNGDLAIAPGVKGGKIYKAVQLVAISAIIASATLLLLELFRLLDIGSTANGVICTIGVFGVGGLSALPWVRVYESIEERHFKITAIAFLALIGLCVILWTVSAWQVVRIVDSIKADMADEALSELLDSLNVIRVSLIVSLQFIIATSIAMNIIKYRKTLLPYQILSGISKLYIDFYITLAMTAFTITREGLELSKTATIFTNQWLFPLLIVFVLLTAFPTFVFKRADSKRLLAAKRQEMNEELNAANSQTPAPAPAPTPAPAYTPAYEDPFDSYPESESVEVKLQKIKSLLDRGLITQEEYDAKRAEILKNL